MNSQNQLIGIILILIGLFDVVVFARVMVSSMQRQNTPESQINITKKSIFFVGLICIGLGIALYAEIIG
jgi:hypothetical protein